MFTSSGFFRGINCPFYSLGNGTCRRPYCQFRHIRNTAATETEKRPPPGSIDNVYPETANVSNYIIPTPTLPTPPATSSPNVQYIPTPIAEIALARRRHKMASKRKSAGKDSTPMYVPTPLSQITAQLEVGGRSYHATSLAGRMQGKYSLDRDHSTDDDEYDPLASNALLISSMAPGMHPNTDETSGASQDVAIGGVSVTSCKYSMENLSERTSNQLYDPMNNSTVDRKSLQISSEIGRMGVQIESTDRPEAKVTKPEYSADADGLYNFDDNSSITEESLPLRQEYLPSKLDADPSSGTGRECEPNSNLSSTQHTCKRKQMPSDSDNAEFSSDCEALVIVENNISDSLTDEEPPTKKLKQSPQVEAESTLRDADEVDKKDVDGEWMTGMPQASVLSDNIFCPPSDGETVAPPSYSYNPSKSRHEDANDSNGEDWNPNQYLSELSMNTEDSVGGQITTLPTQVKTKDVEKTNGKKVPINVKRKDSSLKKKTSVTKERKNTPSKPTEKVLIEKPESDIVRADPFKQTDELKPAPKPSVKVSSEELSSFFNRMSSQKGKPTRSKSVLKTSKPKSKSGSTSAQGPSAAPSKPVKMHKSPESTWPADTTNNKTTTKTTEGDQVVDTVVISSSSSEDPDKDQTRSKDVSGKDTAGKIGSRKASNLMLFGDDSDSSEGSDLFLMESSNDEVVLISDGYSSRDVKPKMNKDIVPLDRVAKKEVRKKTSKEEDGILKHRKPSKGSSKMDPKKHSSSTSSKKMDKKRSNSGKSENNIGQRKEKSCKVSSGAKELARSKSAEVISGEAGKTVAAPPGADSASRRRRSEEKDSSSGEEDYAPLSDAFLTDLSFSESDTFEECLRIFHEDNTAVKKPEERMKSPEPVSISKEDLVLSTSKQRVAHISRFDVSRHKKVTPRPKMRPSPLQVCHNRYIQAQERIRERQPQVTPKKTTSDIVIQPAPTSDAKRRIAHVPSARESKPPPSSSGGPALGVNAKIQLKYSIGHSTRSDTADGQQGTVAITAPKGERRIAHQPLKVHPRPIILPDSAGKVPANIRQRYLNLFIDEFLKTVDTEQEAFEEGLKEEKIVYNRATSKNLYLNLSVNNLKRLRSAQLTVSPSKESSLLSNKSSVSHDAILAGKPATQHSYTLNRSHGNRPSATEPKYEGAFLYQKLKKYVLTEQLLVDNGYPRSSNEPGLATVKVEATKKPPSTDPNKHICSRCGSMFLRRPDGHYITRDSCVYHYGKYWNNKVGGSLQTRFSCCSAESDGKGCCVSKYHVTDDKLGDLTGFMKTVAKLPQACGHPGIYAIDCEMCYTVKALELTRVTVIDDQLMCVYDTFVKPSAEIVDYNTRFSGITEDDLKFVTTTLQDVQAVLLSMLSSESILIGHSLESDLLSLKMIHSVVIDTAIVFPHRRGPPFKRALKTLMGEFLNIIIQNDVSGHDSQEDAKSCMQLMIWKAKQDAKKPGSTVYAL